MCPDTLPRPRRPPAAPPGDVEPPVERREVQPGRRAGGRRRRGRLTRLVRITVTDTGNGIRTQDIDRVFEPFDRLGAESSGVEGTGVGLTLSKYLVERMGGTIEVHSRLGEGTTFTVDLATATAPEAPVRRSRVATGRAASRGHAAGPAHRGQPRQPRAGRAGPHAVGGRGAAGDDVGKPRARPGPPSTARISSSSTSTSRTCRGRTCSTMLQADPRTSGHPRRRGHRRRHAVADPAAARHRGGCLSHQAHRHPGPAPRGRDDVDAAGGSSRELVHVEPVAEELWGASQVDTSPHVEPGPARRAPGPSTANAVRVAAEAASSACRACRFHARPADDIPRSLGADLLHHRLHQRPAVVERRLRADARLRRRGAARPAARRPRPPRRPGGHAGGRGGVGRGRRGRADASPLLHPARASGAGSSGPSASTSTANASTARHATSPTVAATRSR